MYPDCTVLPHLQEAFRRAEAWQRGTEGLQSPQQPPSQNDPQDAQVIQQRTNEQQQGAASGQVARGG